MIELLLFFAMILMGVNVYMWFSWSKELKEVPSTIQNSAVANPPKNSKKSFLPKKNISNQKMSNEEGEKNVEEESKSIKNSIFGKMNNKKKLKETLGADIEKSMKNFNEEEALEELGMKERSGTEGNSQFINDLGDIESLGSLKNSRKSDKKHENDNDVNNDIESEFAELFENAPDSKGYNDESLYNVDKVNKTTDQENNYDEKLESDHMESVNAEQNNYDHKDDQLNDQKSQIEDMINEVSNEEESDNKEEDFSFLENYNFEEESEEESDSSSENVDLNDYDLSSLQEETTKVNPSENNKDEEDFYTDPDEIQERLDRLTKLVNKN